MAKGALTLLAGLETAGARSDASPVVVRLVRQELARILPGAWEAASVRARAEDTDGMTSTARAVVVLDFLEHLLAVAHGQGEPLPLPQPDPEPPPRVPSIADRVRAADDRAREESRQRTEEGGWVR